MYHQEFCHKSHNKILSQHMIIHHHYISAPSLVVLHSQTFFLLYYDGEKGLDLAIQI